MARESYIWVVVDPAKGTNSVSTWTVKHEMIGWVCRQPSEVIDRMEVLRYPYSSLYEWIEVEQGAQTLKEKIEPVWFNARSLVNLP